MRRFIVASTLGLLAVLALVLPGVAAKRWCATDPIVRLGGVEYQVIVSVPEENVPQVNGPLKFDIYSAEDVSQEILFVDAGYNGHGEKINLKKHDHSRSKHAIFMKVPRSGNDFPVLMEVYRDGQLVASLLGDTKGIWFVDDLSGGDGDEDDEGDGD